MPGLPALLVSARRIPWKTLFVAGQQLYKRSKQFRENLSEADRSRLGELLRKSKGKRSNLTDTEVTQLRDLVRKGFTK